MIIVSFIIIAVVLILIGIYSKQHPNQTKNEPTITVESSRPTVTRVVAGGILAGPIGALAGFAFRKLTKNKITIS